jgi:hypothetical protein
MNVTRLTSLAAASVITAFQWALCVALFLHMQPVSAVTSSKQIDNNACQQQQHRGLDSIVLPCRSDT